MRLTQAETEIRLTVKDNYFNEVPFYLIDKKVKKIIFEAIKEIKIKELKKVAVKSLWAFYEQQKREIKNISIADYKVFLAVLFVQNKQREGFSNKTQAVEYLEDKGIKTDGERVWQAKANIYGQPLHEFEKNYERKVKPVLDRLSEEYALDPDDVSGRNSLRNRAEMEVRYQAHIDNIDELKAKGVKLVIASTHTDCSERCRPWQGKVYSLDKTSGTTDDGREYQPLENATDVFYKTKAGKVYKNGLLGFNCRHYLVAYVTGLEFNTYTEEDEKKQYEITLEQRRFEREIRKNEIKAIENKGNNKRLYDRYKNRARALRRQYEEFSKRNGRAFYPSRLDI